MNDDVTVKSKKRLAVKIIIPVILVFIVAGIWVLKNKNDKDVANTDNSDFGLHVTGQIDMDKMKSYGIPIIIDFGSDSCIPCKEMAPVLEELNEELRGKAIIRFVDVRKYPALAEGYPISVIPTQVFFDAEGNPYTPKNTDVLEMTQYSLKSTGELAYTVHEGAVTKEQLLSILKEMGMEQ